LALFTGALLALTVALSSCGGEKKQDKVLRHVVMFGFKPEVTAEQVKAVEDAFGELPSKIDLIKDYEWGTDCSPEGLQQGLTHCFFVTFHSEADRDGTSGPQRIRKSVGKQSLSRHRLGLLDEVKEMIPKNGKMIPNVILNNPKMILKNMGYIKPSV
jgi:hypothetical protein